MKLSVLVPLSPAAIYKLEFLADTLFADSGSNRKTRCAASLMAQSLDEMYHLVKQIHGNSAPLTTSSSFTRRVNLLRQDVSREKTAQKDAALFAKTISDLDNLFEE